jgi:hypothetical protein
MSSKAPIPGMMWVNSDVIKPDSLARDAFDAWYCDEHIPDVMAKSGIASAARYDHMINGPSAPRRLGFLTIYQMPDIHYANTADFKALEGQSPGPNRDTIFVNSEFETRFYELVQEHEAEGMKGSGMRRDLRKRQWTGADAIYRTRQVLALCSSEAPVRCEAGRMVS